MEMRNLQNRFSTIDDCYRFLQQHFIERDTRLITDIHNGVMSKEDFLKAARQKLKDMGIPQEIIDPTVLKLDRRVFGYGEEIDALIDDMDISDIRILGSNEIYYKKNGVRYRADTYFKNAQDYKEYFQLVASKNEKNLGAFNATQTFTDVTSHTDFRLRISLTTTYLTTDRLPYITIRKLPKVKRSADYLLNAGLFSDESLRIVHDLAKKNASILVVGKGGSGKTTLINHALDFIPRQKAVLIAQENEELFHSEGVEQENMCLHTVSINGTNGTNVKYDLRTLIEKGLTQDIDTFMIGETKGAEAYDFLIALNSGTASWTSAHASSVTGAFEKMAMLASCAPEGKLFRREDYMRMLCVLDAVIFMDDFKVLEIARPVRFNTDTELIEVSSIYRHPDYDKEE